MKIVLIAIMSLWSATASAQTAAKPAPSKPATEATKRENTAVRENLNFADRQDFEDARRGLIGRPDPFTIKNAQGHVVWDLEQDKTYISDDKPAPDTVNPSLWRNTQLNMHYGLFKVVDGIYQVRGYDISNITFVQGKKGWIVGDPLSAAETAKAAYDLVTQHLGKKPIVAVIYTHSHADHYGGVRGIVNEADVKAGKVKIFAPDRFTEETVAENVIAGNAMGRRATYMVGAMLPRNATGGINSGLGRFGPIGGTMGLILPTDIIYKTGEKRVVDGVEMVFQMTPGTEAPAEMNVFFPQFKSIWMAENANHTLHNLLTLRGAQVRNALVWSKFLEQTIALYGRQIESEFGSHHWPMWGNERVLDFLTKQSSLYKYLHDQAVNLMNKGYTGTEISEMVKLPPELDKAWYSRGYYGTVRHNVRAVYQRYMGWYDANPSTLNQLSPEPAAKKYVEYMGGAEAVLKRAKADFDEGEYRWVAEALKHVVFADPNNREAKELLADTYEQLGYQAEAGTWRSIYLTGAYELRNGVPSGLAIQTDGPDTVRAMLPDMLFDYWGVRVNGEKAASKKLVVGFNFTDLKKQYTLTLQNGALTQSARRAAKPDARLTLSKATLDRIQLKETTVEQAISAGQLKIEGRREAVEELVGMLDTFPFWFNIVTP